MVPRYVLSHKVSPLVIVIDSYFYRLLHLPTDISIVIERKSAARWQYGSQICFKSQSFLFGNCH